MAGGCTTVEIKSGYGLDTDSELRLLNAAKALGESEPVRDRPDPARAPRPSRRSKDRARITSARSIDKMIPAVAKAGLATSVDAFCETIAFTAARGRAAVQGRAPRTASRVRLHAEQLSQPEAAPRSPRAIDALSADHLEHLDEAGAAAMAAAGTVAVLLPGAFYALQEKRKPPVDLLRKPSVPMAVATDCNPGTSPLLSPTLAMNMACTLFGLTPEEALAGMTVNAARALGLDSDIGSIAPGKAADLAVWRVESLAELGYWIGLPGPERRIFAGWMPRARGGARRADLLGRRSRSTSRRPYGNGSTSARRCGSCSLLHRPHQSAGRDRHDDGRVRQAASPFVARRR